MPTTTEPAPKESKDPATLLADAAVSMLGKDASPRNRAPQELSCAEGVSGIAHLVWPDFPDDIISTQVLLHYLKTSPRFKPVLDPLRGCVVVSPTVGTNHGHTGIYTQPDRIASNDSRTGLFEENYTRASWRAYFIAKKGLKGFLFMPVDIGD